MRIRRLAAWRVTVTFRPLFVVAFVFADIALRLASPLMERLITRHPQILHVLNMATGVLLALGLLVMAACAISSEPRRDRDS